MTDRNSFTNRLSDALDERIGYRHAMRDFLDEKIVGGARWSYAIGSALITLVAAEAITGLVLMTAYSPSSTTAWASVHHIQYQMPFGWLVRGIHHFGSDAIIALTGLHMVRTAVAGAYKGKRDVNWWLGLLLLGLIVGFAITGGRLMWDQFAYWALQVETNIAGTTPVIGPALGRLAQGGARAGNLTITRLYALHVGILPLLLIATLGAHSYLRRRHGFAPSGDPNRVDSRAKQLMIDTSVALAAIIVVVVLAVRAHGAPLDAPADPVTDYPARPEWYLLPLYELRKLTGKLEMIATMVVPGLAIAFLAALPVIDRKPDNSLRARWFVIVPLLVGLIAPGVLVALAKRADARDEKYQKALAAASERATYAIELAKAGIPPDGPLEMLARDPKIRGEEIWKKECATCHTIDGKGNKEKKGAPDLLGWGTTAWAELTVRDPDAPTRFGKTPFKGEMPSAVKPKPGKEEDFKPMPEPDVKAVSAFVAGEKNARGAEVFDDWCSGCHKLADKGGDDSDLAPNLTGWGTYPWLRSQIADPAAGDTYKPEASDPKLKGHMPAFNDSDIKDEIDVIARWTYWKARGSWPPVPVPVPVPAPASASAPPATTTSAQPPKPAPAPSAPAPKTKTK
jgi:ubiquinol-cytochrome c reductase cytochrome b subunit